MGRLFLRTMVFATHEKTVNTVQKLTPSFRCLAVVAGLMSALAVHLRPGIADEHRIDWRGAVVLDGEYIPAPYDVAVTDGTVTVNGHVVSKIPSFTDDEGRGGRARRGPRAGRGGRGRRFAERGLEPNEIPPGRLAVRIEQEIEAGSFLVSLPGQPDTAYSIFQRKYEVAALLTKPPAQRSVEEIAHVRPAEADEEQWQAWLAGFETPPALHETLLEFKSTIDRRNASNESEIQAQSRLSSFAYPLTTIGMLFCVLSAGHLLRNPSTGASQGVDESASAMQFVTRSLILVIVLSVLDLVWTILAHQAGQMRELNPLGSTLITDPSALVIFKLSMTAVATGILYVLRRYRSVQLGTWWACMICTLLTARWLVLNSLFVA